MIHNIFCIYRLVDPSPVIHNPIPLLQHKHSFNNIDIYAFNVYI